MEQHLAGPWLRLERGKTEVLDRVGRIIPEMRDRRPSPLQWSLAGVVEHLVRVEHGVTAALAKAPSPERPRRFPRWQRFRFLSLRVALKAGARIKAPVESILPTGELPWHALLSRWDEQRRTFEEWLLSVEPAILGKPRFRHPYVGWLNVRQTVTFAADHLEHHRRQITRLEKYLRTVK